jgi:hypothetical protein
VTFALVLLAVLLLAVIGGPLVAVHFNPPQD